MASHHDPALSPVRRRRVVVLGSELTYLLRFRSHLLRAMVAAGHVVSIATPDVEPASSPLADIGVAYHRVSMRPTGMDPRRDLTDLVAMVRWFRQLRPDVVFAYGAKPTTLGLAAAALTGVTRRYAMLPGLGYAFIDDGRRSFMRGVARVAQLAAYGLLLRGCERVIFHNEDDRDELVRRHVVGRDQAAVVAGSGVDLTQFEASPVPTSPVRFLFVGRLLRSKGVEELVQAARALRSEVPTAEVHLVGSVDANPDQIDQALLDAARARGDVICHGHVSDVRPHLRQCSAFVLPSYREGLPRSALEALATGRTTIVTDVPGCREVVRQGLHGTLVPVRDAHALATALISYARDPQRLIGEGQAARRTAEDVFGVAAVTGAMMTLLGLRRDPEAS